MKLNRYDLPTHPWEYTEPNSFGNWCKTAEVAQLEEAHEEIMNFLKSWLPYTKPNTGRELYHITNDFMKDIIAVYNSVASKTGGDLI